MASFSGSGDNNNYSSDQVKGQGQGQGQDDDDDLEQARLISEQAVDQVLSSATESFLAQTQQKSDEVTGSTKVNNNSSAVDEVKEHDVEEEEVAEASRLESELAQELEENDGWVKILGNDELMKKVI